MEALFTDNKSAVVSSDRILYTSSSFARSSLLHLQEIGTLHALRPHVSSRERLNSYLFFIVVSGSGSLSYDGKDYELTKGSCVFVDCRKSYSHSTPLSSAADPEGDLWSLKWVHFYGPSMTHIYEKYCERGGRPVFVPEFSADFERVLSSLYEIAGSSDYMRDMKINENLSGLLTLIMAESWHPEDAVQTSKRSSVLEVKEYLDKNYREKITLDEICGRFYISKHYLTHCFKEQFGMSITNYLLSVRITHAKRLLRFSDKSVEEIGYEVGIGALNYFSRVFKEVEGVPPSLYRQQW